MTTPTRPPTAPSSAASVAGITEHDIAQFLLHNPGFFERHAELLSAVQLTSPHGQRAVSLQERQMEMLRERIKGLEMKIVEMIRHGQENLAIQDRLNRYTHRILTTLRAEDLPSAMVASLRHEFLIPQVALRAWGTAQPVPGREGETVSEDVQSFAASLAQPYCGANVGFEAAQWLDDPASVLSMAMVPLRRDSACLGLLVLGSPDPTRYAADMGTDFLVHIGDIASAALTRLQADAP